MNGHTHIASSLTLPEPGSYLAGYQLGELIGAGGFAAVYRARCMRLRREVAVKVIPCTGDREARRRAFECEVDLASRLEHPNIVRLYDADLTDDGRHFYLVMELVRGEELAAVVEREGRFDPVRAHHIMLQVVDALAQAHRLGVLHRDLKPANIMLTRCGSETSVVKILDFGVGCALDPNRIGDDQPTLDLVSGTPRYMPPEAICRDTEGPWGDVYSAGLILAEMLQGFPVVGGDIPFEVLGRHLKGQFDLAPALLRSAFGPIIERAARTDWRERYPNALELYRALEAIDPERVAPLCDLEPSVAARASLLGIPVDEAPLPPPLAALDALDDEQLQRMRGLASWFDATNDDLERACEHEDDDDGRSTSAAATAESTLVGDDDATLPIPRSMLAEAQSEEARAIPLGVALSADSLPFLAAATEAAPLQPAVNEASLLADLELHIDVSAMLADTELAVSTSDEAPLDGDFLTPDDASPLDAIDTRGLLAEAPPPPTPQAFAAPPRIETVAPTRPRVLRWLTLVGCLLGAIAGIVGLAALHGEGTEVHPAPTAVREASAADSQAETAPADATPHALASGYVHLAVARAEQVANLAAASAVPHEAEVEWRVDSTPRGASVMRDETTLCSATPCTVRLQRADATTALTIALDGHHSARHELVPNNAGVVRVVLEPVAPPAAAAAAEPARDEAPQPAASSPAVVRPRTPLAAKKPRATPRSPRAQHEPEAAVVPAAASTPPTPSVAQEPTHATAQNPFELLSD